MTAKEMFEELGYIFTKESNLDHEEKEHLFIYKRYHEPHYSEISFNNSTKLVAFQNECYGQHSFTLFGQETIKAIHQQVKELGWFE